MDFVLFQSTLNFPKTANWSNVQVGDCISGMFTDVTESQNARTNLMKRAAKMVYTSSVLALVWLEYFALKYR